MFVQVLSSPSYKTKTKRPNLCWGAYTVQPKRPDTRQRGRGDHNHKTEVTYLCQ